MINNVILNIFSVLLLSILLIYSYSRHDKNSFQQRIYYIMLICTILLLTLDIFSRYDGYPDTLYSIFNRAGNFLLFILNPVLPSIWLIYVDQQIYHDDQRIKRLLFPLLVLTTVNVALVIISQYYGWYYSIDANNMYHRGPLFFIPAMLILSLLFAAFLNTMLHRKMLAKKQLVPLILFPILPVAGILLQLFIYGVAFALNGTVLSLLIVNLSFQNDDVYTDFLTGVGNRKKFEAVIKERVAKSSQNRTFSLIMLDINNFKETNDTLGHDTGDKVLKAFAEILEKSVRSKDYVTRYGGDEFCLIMDISDQSSLEAAVRRINSEVVLFNQSGLIPFKTSCSMGYAVYDHQTGLSAEDFLKHVDTLLYENKRLQRGSQI